MTVTRRSRLQRVRAGDRLTPRELEILALVASGERTLAIAGRLGLSENTVKSHLTRTYKKIGARSRVEAARHYAEHHAGARRDDGAGDRAPASSEGAGDDLLERQIGELQARIEELTRTIAEATDESRRLQDALVALRGIRARRRPTPAPGAGNGTRPGSRAALPA